jgi:transposase InsO family protein
MLKPAFEELSQRRYRHPTKAGEWVRFGASSIERWYYAAKAAADPVAALGRKVRSDAGRPTAMSAALLAALGAQYTAHKRWSYQLQADNLAALVREQPELGPMPSYATVCRRMQERGWRPQRGAPVRPTAGEQAALERREKRELRGFEAEYVMGLLHLDFHVGKRRVADAQGRYHKPVALAVLDDRSRLCCHMQWYLAESAENLVHGLCQAFAKRGLPRALMTDNGSAMLAHETTNGLFRLAVKHATTLAHSPYQNGKQEAFWGSAEGRLMAMLEQVDPLSLAFLNRATQAWCEMEYNRERHSETGMPPLERLLEGPSVARPAPDAETLRQAFCDQEVRTQRYSDGTITLCGVRFEVPSAHRHVRKVHVRYRSWDLSAAYLVDPRTGIVLSRLLPQDKTRNADARRRTLPECAPQGEASPETGRTADPVPPLMRRLLAEYAATGLPPAYLPKEECDA